MPILDLSIDELLTTTCSVRKRLDLTRSVEAEVIRNASPWHYKLLPPVQARADILWSSRIPLSVRRWSRSIAKV